MSKRKISHKQLSRIKIRQDNYQQLDNAELQHGLVIARHGKHLLIENAQRVVIRCSIRANIDSITAGDHIMWQPDGCKHGVVVSCLPRKSVLARLNDRGESRAIAANVTQLMIVISANPMLSWTLLDSYLIMAEILQLSACIVLNKSDLACDEIKTTLENDYKSLGYPIIITNQHADGIDALKLQLVDQVSVFVGQSGVGKSSLISLLLPDEASEIKTAAVSESSQLGCHTTRNARWYHLPSGGALIDSPGVREFSLGQIPQAEIARGYREFRPYIGQCKFRNCEHITSPGCAILIARKNNEISRQRYESYVKIYFARSQI